MRRVAFMLALAAVPLLGVVPASADFHGACAPTPPAVATVRLSHGGGALTYGGDVVCGGASSISVNSLTMKRPDDSVASAGPASCSNCSSLSHQASDADLSAGYRVVDMSFTVVGNNATITRPRQDWWYWNQSTLTRACGAPGNGSTNLVATGSGLTFIGALSCPAAQSLTMTSFTLTRPDGSVVAASPLPSCASGGTTVCSSLTATATAPPAGPGRYRVDLVWDAQSRDVSRTAVAVTGAWYWLGAGPLVRSCPTGIGALNCL